MDFKTIAFASSKGNLNFKPVQIKGSAIRQLCDHPSLVTQLLLLDFLNEMKLLSTNLRMKMISTNLQPKELKQH